MPDITVNTEVAENVAGWQELDDQDAKENREILKDYRSARMPWYKDRVENDRFFHNVQFSDSEESDIESTGQSPLAINIVYPIIKQMISLLTGNKPIWSVDPVGDSDKEIAYLHRKLLDATWYNSRGSRHFEQISKEMLITGVGWGMVNPRSTAPFGMTFKYIPYHNVYLDPYLTTFDVNEADNIVISKIISSKQASIFLNRPEEEILAYSEGDDTLREDEDIVYPRYVSPVFTNSERKSRPTRIIQRLSLERTKCYVVTPIKNAVFKRRVYFKLTEDLERLRANGSIRIEEVERTVVAKYVSVGKYCEKYYLPVDKYNIAAFIDEFNGNAFFQGEVDFLYGLQRALNKFVLLTLLNATLANNMKMMSPKGAINKSDYLKAYSIPGAMIEYEWSKDQPIPQQINPQALAGEFFTFPKMLISIMEYVTGVFGVVQGNPEGAPRTASGLISLQNYGGQKTKLLGRNMEEGLTQLGDAAIALFQNYAGYSQVISYFNQEIGEAEQVSFNTLSVNLKGEIEVENDLSQGQYQTRVVVRQDYGSERQAKAAVLANLAAQTRSPVLIKPILELADIPEADKIAKDLDEITKRDQTISQLQQNLKRLSQINTQLENEVLRKGRQVELSKFVANLEGIAERFKSEYGMKAFQELQSLKDSFVSQEVAQQDSIGSP